MELALVFGIAMILALRASMVGASGDGSADGGTAASENGGETSVLFTQIAEGTFEIYMLNSTCTPTLVPDAWVHSEFDSANPGSPHVVYWLLSDPILIPGAANTRLLFKPTTKASDFVPSDHGSLSAVRTAFIDYASVDDDWQMHIHHVANVI